MAKAKKSFKFRASPALFGILFAVIGITLLIAVKAQPQIASFFASDSTLNGPAKVVNDTSASKGKNVQFGQAEKDLIVAIAGDIQPIASDLGGALTTSNMLENQIKPDYILAPGDLQYENGTLNDFNTYFSKTWGRPSLYARLYPAPGNHEYNTPNATGYYTYFKAANNSIADKTVTGPAHQGYYAFDMGKNWRVYSYNTETISTSLDAQLNFIRSDMAANPRPCTLFFGHKPYYDYGTRHDGEANNTLPIMKLMYDTKSELVFWGHEHNYQRFKQVNPYTDAEDTVKGIRPFVTGAGGKTLHPDMGATANNSKNLIVTNNATTHGILKLTLRSNLTYEWQYIPSSGTYTDSGTGQCQV